MDYILRSAKIKLMSDQTDILNLVKLYGLSEDEGRVYLYLLEHGYTPVLTISRSLKIGRTKIYRLLEKLQSKHLTEAKINERGLHYGATDPVKFSQILTDKESDLNRLKASHEVMLERMHAMTATTNQSSKVLYYEGIEGLKQISFNITNADRLLRVYEVEHLNDFLPEEFSEMIRRKIVERKISIRDLTNKASFPDYTKVTEMVKSYSEFRYIPKEKLSIDFEILIYNDIFATYTYKEDNIFCVEIHNPELARMQKQIFDFIWSYAEKMKFTSPFGASKLKSTA